MADGENGSEGRRDHSRCQRGGGWDTGISPVDPDEWDDLVIGDTGGEVASLLCGRPGLLVGRPVACTLGMLTEPCSLGVTSGGRSPLRISGNTHCDELMKTRPRAKSAWEN